MKILHRNGKRSLAAVGLRTYVAELDRGRRDWSKEPAAQTPVYANRRRIRGARGRHLMRQRGERIERSFAHLYDTGGMRRTHLRGCVRNFVFESVVID